MNRRPAYGVGHEAVVVDYERNARESLGVKGGNPVEHLLLLAVVAVDKAVCLAPLSESESVDEVNLVGVVELGSQRLEELGILLLEHGVVGIRRPVLGVAGVLKALCSGFLDVERRVLPLVAAVNNYAEGQLHAPVSGAFQQAVEL